MTRRPGVAALTAGPGVTNGMSAMASALQNNSPMIVLGGLAGLEILRPMALVIVGGLITSSFVTLFVVPTALRATPAAEEPEQPAAQIHQSDMSPA